MFNYLFGRPAEYGFWNPAHAKIKDGVTIDTLDTRGKDYFLEGIREYTRTYQGEKVIHTAYDLTCRQLGKDVEKIRLLYMPLAHTDAAGKTHMILLLQETDSMEYNENLHNALVPEREGKPDNGEFQVFDDDNTLIESWWRIDDQRGPNNVAIAIVHGRQDGKKITKADIIHETSKYWDFSRTIKSDGNVDFDQFQFFEMRDRDHYIWGYRGEPIDESQIAWRFI